MPDERVANVGVTRVEGTSATIADDVLAVEEPLEIRVAWRTEDDQREKNISVTMRTPGDDFDLAAGFLLTEGLLRSSDEIDSLQHWSSPNVVRVSLRNGARIDMSKLGRHFYTTSSCGVCGKTSIAALRVVSAPIRKPARATAEVIHRLPVALREQQALFGATGGLHGAAVCDANGAVLRVREDVGRHNAVDKVIGSLFLEQAMPLDNTILVVSSRAGFEIAQKAIVAGIPLLAAFGAPSSLAVDLAREFGLTLVGFVREDRFNVYAGEIL